MAPFMAWHRWAACTMALFALAPGTGAAASPPPRSAERPTASADGDVPSVRLSYADLDLNTPAGVASLYVRIRHAAAQLCDAKKNVTGSRLSAAFDGCVRTTIEATVRQVGVPGLVALHAEQQALEYAPVPSLDCAHPSRARIII